MATGEAAEGADDSGADGIVPLLPEVSRRPEADMASRKATAIGAALAAGAAVALFLLALRQSRFALPLGTGWQAGVLLGGACRVRVWGVISAPEQEPAMSATPVPASPVGKRPSWRRRLLCLAVSAGCVYLGVLLVLRAFENRLVFHPVAAADDWDPPPSADCQDVDLRTADGTRLHAWWLPCEGASGAVLCCHGNAGNLSYWGPVLADLRHGLGESVLVVDYPGYGRSTGQPSEAGCYAAADAAYDWLTRTKQVAPERVVLYGESLGGGVVVDVASRRPHRALVLVSTFTSLPDVGQHHLPWLPVGWVIRNRFDSVAKIGRCHSPVFIVHGTADGLVPLAMGRRLFDAANEPKVFLPVDGAGHNDLPTSAFVEQLGQFLAAHPPSPAATPGDASASGRAR